MQVGNGDLDSPRTDLRINLLSQCCCALLASHASARVAPQRVRAQACMHAHRLPACVLGAIFMGLRVCAHRLGLSHFLQDLRAQTWFARMHACMLASGRLLEGFVLRRN